jgi:hypothetical protein
LQAFQITAQFANIGCRVRFVQKDGCIQIGEVIAADQKQVLVRVTDNHSQAIPRVVLVELIGRLQ